MRITYIGGPTALLELGGLRLLTDPTFDPAGTTYPTAEYTLRKTMGPARASGSLLPVDAVLLSHDHHFDNLDHAGRAMLRAVPRVLTTMAGASRLRERTIGLAPWQALDLTAPDGRIVRVTATPARHGPAHADRGPVIGFVLEPEEDQAPTVYLSGDTVWYEGIQEVAARFPVDVALLFMGAARVAPAGPWNVTFTAEEGVEAARAFEGAAIVPVHFEGWEHFSESMTDIAQAFAAAAISSRLRWPAPGVPTEVEMAAKARARDALARYMKSPPLMESSVPVM